MIAQLKDVSCGQSLKCGERAGSISELGGWRYASTGWNSHARLGSGSIRLLGWLDDANKLLPIPGHMSTQPQRRKRQTRLFTNHGEGKRQREKEGEIKRE